VRSWADGLYQFLGSNHLVGVIQPRNFYVTDLLNVVVPTELQIVAPDAAVAITRRFTGNGSEWNGYLGLPLALFGNLLPNRLALYVELCAAVLTAVFVDRVVMEGGRKGRGVAAVALALVVVTLLPRLPYQTSPATTPVFFESTAAQRFRQGEVVLVAPFSSTPAATEPLLWQAQSGMRFKVPEGYFFTAGEGSHPRLEVPRASRWPIACWRSSMAPPTAASRQTRRRPSAATRSTTGWGRWWWGPCPISSRPGPCSPMCWGGRRRSPGASLWSSLVLVNGVTPPRPGPGGCHRKRRLFPG